MRRQLRARKLSMELESSSLDRSNNTTNNSGTVGSSEDYLLSDTADCSLMLMPPPPTNRNANANGNTNSSPAAARDVHQSAARKKAKGMSKLVQRGSGGNDTSSSPVRKNSPKATLFSAVMSLSNTNNNNSTPSRDDTENDRVKTMPSYHDATTSSNDATSTTTSSIDNVITHNTATPQKTSSNGRNRLHKSPILFSPGGYEILKALDGANLYAYPEYETGDMMLESDNDQDGEEDGHLVDEWQDATIYFNNDEYAHNTNTATVANAKKSTEDMTDIMEDEHPLQHYSSIVEATTHATDFADINEQCTKTNSIIKIPEPIGVGVMDWSLKRRLRLECVPGRCLPQSFSSSSYDEGRLHQMALQYLSRMNDDSGRIWSQRRRRSCSRDVAMAKWLASTMYYQYPAIHPLPSSILSSSKDVGAADSGTRQMTRASSSSSKQQRDISSFIVGPHSIHNRVRLPAAGCMGGLGIISVVPSDRIDKAAASNNFIGKQNRRSNNDKSSLATVSSLLHQRRRDWQEAFRSMFHSWTSRLKSLQESQGDIWSKMDQSTTTTPAQDDVSRCSFYAILPHQTILFRGGYVDGASSDDAANHSIVPMIVFSSTTKCLRSKLKSMGVHLRVATQNEHVDGIDERMNCEVLFTESLLDASTTTNGVASGEGDAESVQSDLDVMKLVNNDKDQVRVEVKKRNQQRRLGKAGSVRLPSLFVYGDDDCATVYELLLNTYGLSVGLEETKASKSGIESVALDVPLLLCRSLGPCMHTTLRTLSFSSRRNCGYLNQTQTNGSNMQRDINSISKAALELRGPILPCAIRDMTCAAVNFMMLDNYDQVQSSTTPHSMTIDNQSRDMYGENNPDTESASSHQFLMSLQAHEGEYASTAPKSTTGSPSSTEFNGSIPLYQKNGNQTAVGSAVAWKQCGHGDYVDKLVWDISRKSVVSFHTFS